ncbi:MAG TPA: sialate O-acetylesterase [Opitutales bacterium]|nr:sialate O-acetylesterase [Opitutales bacterium]
MKLILRYALFPGALLLPFIVQAKLEVSDFFGDHMVLQRGQPLPVWGTATPNTEVTVTFRNDSISARADSEGKWLAKLPPQKTGDPVNLKITSDGEVVVFNDVLVGEVWICSGQSNMEWRVDRSANPEAEIAAANYPSIRLFDLARSYSPEPLDSVDASWRICSPATVASFSAVGYYFGRKLWQELQVPIGLISSNWGGTPAEAWTPLKTLESNPDYAEIVATYHDSNQLLRDNPDLEAKMQAVFDKYASKIAALGKAPPQPDASWFDPDADMGPLESVQPGVDFLEDTNGLVHVRKFFTLTAEEAKRSGARIKLGQIDNFDTTWINGVAVGMTNSDVRDSRAVARDYAIPDGTLKAGQNVALIQIVDIRRIAHFGKNIDHPEIVWEDTAALPLQDGWEMQIVSDLGRRPPTLERKMRNTGSYLWNGMICPLIPAAFRGVIWYQGESNASRAEQYQTLFPDMIQAWRNEWGRGDFPFYFVQLAGITGRVGWPELREAQRRALRLPNTGMAVTIDIGDPDDVHPKNKQDVGLRLALWALAKTYGQSEARSPLGQLPLIGQLFQKPIPHSGPLFKKATINGGRIRLHFDHVYNGLITSDGQALNGFEIAGADGIFKPAEARIDGDHVLLSHPDISTPTAARYAWHEYPEGANLSNSAGLPASPFRTGI